MGTCPVAFRWSSTKASRLFTASSSRPPTATRARAVSGAAEATSRMNAPIARPSSAGRPMPSPFQNGTRPGCPNAGVTSTRSWVISSIRQLVAPSANTSPTRDS